MEERRQAVELATQAARLAGTIMEKARIDGLVINTKSSAIDLVTQADKAVENAVVAFLREQHPDDQVMAEEHDWGATNGRRCWVIDPIDGTTNYTKDVPRYACSIGLAIDGILEVGVVYNPRNDELFSAVRGEGAWLLHNGQKRELHVSQATTLEQALFITGFFYDRGDMMRNTLDDMRLLMERGCLGTRRYGAASLDFCDVAAGRAEGFWEHRLNPWDFAAGWIIATEAGAVATRSDGKPLELTPGSVAVTCPGITTQLMDVLLRR